MFSAYTRADNNSIEGYNPTSFSQAIYNKGNTKKKTNISI